MTAVRSGWMSAARCRKDSGVRLAKFAGLGASPVSNNPPLRAREAGFVRFALAMDLSRTRSVFRYRAKLSIVSSAAHAPFLIFLTSCVRGTLLPVATSIYQEQAGPGIACKWRRARLRHPLVQVSCCGAIRLGRHMEALAMAGVARRAR